MAINGRSLYSRLTVSTLCLCLLLSLQLANGDHTQATVRLFNESHTTGNAIRHMVARNPDTAFVGYSMPHPGEPYLNLRIQSTGAPVEGILKTALGNLGDICDAISEEFESEMAKFDGNGKKAMTDA